MQTLTSKIDILTGLTYKKEIRVKLFRTEYEEALKKLPDPHAHYQNTSCVGLFVNAVRKASLMDFLDPEVKGVLSDEDTPILPTQSLMSVLLNKMHELSVPLKELDRCINQVLDENNREREITKVQKLIQEYQKLIHNFDLLFLSETQKQEFTRIKMLLQKSCTEANAKLETLFNNARALETTAQCTQLFKAQSTSNIYSLGECLADQTKALAHAAKDITKVIQDQYLWDLVDQNKYTKAFGKAEEDIHLRGMALHGAEFVDTDQQMKIPEIPQEGWLSLSQYLPDPPTMAEVHQRLCAIYNVKYIPNEPSIFLRMGYFTSMYVLAAPVDIALSLTHAALYIPLLFFRPLAPKSIDRVAAGLATAHRHFSPVKRLKKLWNDLYKPKTSSVVDLPPMESMTEYRNDRPHSRSMSEHEIIQTMSYMMGDESSLADNFEIFQPKDIAHYTWHRFVAPLFEPKIKPITSIAVLEDQYAQNLQIHTALKSVFRAEAAEAAEQEKMYPAPQHQRETKIQSPLRLAHDIAFILSERVLRDILEHHPGPGMFFLLTSLSSFGAGFAPAAGLAWMHGMPQALHQSVTWISQNFTGSSSSAFQQSLGAVLEFKLANLAFIGLLEAANKDSQVLDQLMQNPEKIIMAMATCAAIGQGLAYMPTIPTLDFMNLPGVGNLNLYTDGANALIQSMHTLQGGLFPLTILEETFIGYKVSKLLLHDWALNGYSTDTQRHIRDEVLRAVASERSKLPPDFKGAMQGVFEKYNCPYTEEHLNSVLESFGDAKKLQGDIQENKKYWDNIGQKMTESLSERDPLEPLSLQEKIQQFSNPDCPFTFPSRALAITYYNHLDALFEQNESNEYKIDKTRFMKAFRRKYCFDGSYNAARMFSGFPFSPVREFWREMQLKIWPDNAYVRDKIDASRAKDVVLRHQYTGTGLLVGRTGAFVGEKILKFFAALGVATVVAPVAYVVDRVVQGNQETTFKSKLQQYGMAIQHAFDSFYQRRDENTVRLSEAHKALRRQVSSAAETTSTFDDVCAASQEILKTIERAEKSQVSPISSSLVKPVVLQNDVEQTPSTRSPAQPGMSDDLPSVDHIEL